MVFQSYALFPHLDVAENIVFGLKVRGVAMDERRRRLDRVAELVGLGGLLKRRPAQLSGGQRQRVALARAVIAENPICLMDEPLSNLDAQLRHEMRVEIRALQQRLGMTVIYVTLRSSGSPAFSFVQFLVSSAACRSAHCRISRRAVLERMLPAMTRPLKSKVARCPWYSAWKWGGSCSW
jgi:ABC-type thiamine transport system ATPase subunit